MAKKKESTTYDRLMASMTKKEKIEYEKEYHELLLSELMLAAMAEEEMSVRKLAKAAGASTTIVQGMRSGTVSVRSFVKTLHVL